MRTEVRTRNRTRGTTVAGDGRAAGFGDAQAVAAT